MIDIKIQNLFKFKGFEIDSILQDKNTQFFEKYDGIKINIIRKNTEFDETNISSNFIFSYKGEVFYEFEFLEYQGKIDSLGFSNLYFVINRINNTPIELLKKIPKNTIFFFEFITNKPTLTRDYEILYDLFLLSYAKLESYNVNSCFLDSKEKGVQYENIQELAKYFSVKTPREIFIKNRIKTDKEYLKNYILNLPSELGGKMEGCVIKNKDKFFKIVQDDQYDYQTRLEKKNLYRCSKENEKIYWDKVNEISNLVISNFKEFTLGTLQALKTTCEAYTVDLSHPKKKSINLYDDIYLTSKIKFIRKMEGNKNVLFIGRFQPPSKKHFEIVENLLKDFDNVYLFVVQGKDKQKSPFKYKYIVSLFEKKFQNENLQIHKTYNGDLTKIIKKVRSIHTIVAGSDRINGYKNQLKGDYEFLEIIRDDNISSTNIRNSLNYDVFEIFKENTDVTLHNEFPFMQEMLKDI